MTYEHVAVNVSLHVGILVSSILTLRTVRALVPDPQVELGISRHSWPPCSGF